MEAIEEEREESICAKAGDGWEGAREEEQERGGGAIRVGGRERQLGDRERGGRGLAREGRGWERGTEEERGGGGRGRAEEKWQGREGKWEREKEKITRRYENIKNDELAVFWPPFLCSASLHKRLYFFPPLYCPHSKWKGKLALSFISFTGKLWYSLLFTCSS